MDKYMLSSQQYIILTLGKWTDSVDFEQGGGLEEGVHARTSNRNNLVIGFL
jgi:hypothetical protein